MTNLQIEVLQRAITCTNKFNEATGGNFPVGIKIDFDLKGHTAGQAFYMENRLRFNNELLERYKQLFIIETVDHEMAHLFAYHMSPGCSAHGYTWKYVMHIILGHTDAQRCHSMKTNAARRVAKHSYTCGCGDVHRVGTKLHNKMRKGSHRICSKCHERLVKTV